MKVVFLQKSYDDWLNYFDVSDQIEMPCGGLSFR